MSTAAVTRMTAEEFRLLPDNGRPLELVKGVPLERSLPTPRHGEVCVNTFYLVRRFLDDHPLGRVVGNDAAVITRRNPDTVPKRPTWPITVISVCRAARCRSATST